MITLDGRCKTLDVAADGYVRGEACTALHLEPLASRSASAAAVCLAGTCVNQDGRSSSLTAPNGPSQQQVREHGCHKAGGRPSLPLQTRESFSCLAGALHSSPVECVDVRAG
jgi:acyl transferase domain-containing protein